jgi:hypothetical protein
VKRTSGGYVYANYFNTTPNDVATGTVTKILVEAANDGFMRHGTAAAVADFLKAGFTTLDMSDKLTIERNPGTGVIYNNGHIELRSTNADPVSLGFHRSGYTACQLRHSGNGLVLSGTSQGNSADLTVNGSISEGGTSLVSKYLGIAATATNSALLNGVASDSSNTVSTVVKRDTAGDVKCRLLRPEYVGTAPSFAYINVQNAQGTGDNYVRSVTNAAFRTRVNAGYLGDKAYTVSTSAPSGGSDGDFWFKY